MIPKKVVTRIWGHECDKNGSVEKNVAKYSSIPRWENYQICPSFDLPWWTIRLQNGARIWIVLTQG